MYLIGIDIGTSGTKTVLFDEAGKTIASRTAEYPMFQPRNGWAEQNPEDWWNAVRETLRAVTAKVDRREIAGVGLSGQMHGLVMLDAEGKVIRDAILWCDGRTGKECEEITRLVGRKRLIEITANPALAGFTASKILWARNHEPDNYERCRHILLPKDYIRYRLTGEFATEVSDAARHAAARHREPAAMVAGGPAEAGISVAALLPAVYRNPRHQQAAVTRAAAGGSDRSGGRVPPSPAAPGTTPPRLSGTGVVPGRHGLHHHRHHRRGLSPTPRRYGPRSPGTRTHLLLPQSPADWHVMGVTQAAGLSLKVVPGQFLRTRKRKPPPSLAD